MKNKATNEDLHSLVSVISRGLGVTDSDDNPKFLEAIAMQLGMTPYGGGSTLKEEIQQINENLSDIAGQLGRLADIFSDRSQSGGGTRTFDSDDLDPEILNGRQAAELLGRTCTDVLRYWRYGALKRYKGTKLYNKKDVEAFIEKYRVNTKNGYYYSIEKPRG